MMTPKENNVVLHSETVACTENALLALMQEKEDEDIRMTDIIKRSGVSRGGVYNTYKSKDEILLGIIGLLNWNLQKNGHAEKYFSKTVEGNL